ncbi:hypothetical protein [Kordiimonas marina]|uniref:hypothetical protein n=1 Tax=Kordiimonas marina TaxID=2872312 RepID=UPI001FF456C8|nr:hypothetical protein [Kordiimonas marina]MCJ9429126.1 hypothetical protein [Kordiimonas marina]
MFGTAKKRMPQLMAILMGAGLVGVSAQGAEAQVLYLTKDRNYEVAMQAMKAGDLETAADRFERAVSFDIGSARLLPMLNNLCAVNYVLGHLDKAKEACDRAIREDRHYWRAYVNRGNVFKAEGDLKAARADYRYAVRLAPKADLPRQALARLDNHREQLLAGAH